MNDEERCNFARTMPAQQAPRKCYRWPSHVIVLAVLAFFVTSGMAASLGRWSEDADQDDRDPADAQELDVISTVPSDVILDASSLWASDSNGREDNDVSIEPSQPCSFNSSSLPDLEAEDDGRSSHLLGRDNKKHHVLLSLRGGLRRPTNLRSSQVPCPQAVGPLPLTWYGEKLNASCQFHYVCKSEPRMIPPAWWEAELTPAAEHVTQDERLAGTQLQSCVLHQGYTQALGRCTPIRVQQLRLREKRRKAGLPRPLFQAKIHSVTVAYACMPEILASLDR